MADKIMLIDGHSILNRAFHGLPDLTNHEGLHTNAVMGFLNIMLKYIDEEAPTHLLVAFDRKEPTFRHQMYSEYKGTRKPMAPELNEQVPIMKEVLASMEIPVVTQAGIEADDILGTIAYQAQENGYGVVVVSGDRDLLQLCTDHIKVKIPKTKAGTTITEDYYASDFQEVYGITPKEFIDMKGLMGDSSDNIPGVPGIGEKTAAKIITDYHSIENAYAHVTEIKPPRASKNLAEYYEQAIMSKVLATIKLDCQLTYHFNDAKIGNLFNENAYRQFKRLELRSLLKYFDESVSSSEITTKIDVISEKNTFLDIVQDIKNYKKIGFSLIGRHKTAKGISVTCEDGIKLILADRQEVSSGQLSFDLDGMVSQNGITHDLIREQFIMLMEKGLHIVSLDYKELLHYDDRFRNYTDQIDDAGIMAYLLNPLASGYDYDEIARDQLGMLLPSRKEVCGKAGIEEALDPENDKTINLAAMLSFVPYKASEKLYLSLKDKGMVDLYRKVELPTVATLFDMERYGIRVEKQALSEYGNKLIGRISELETAIHEAAGQQFNINSPKQLGVVLFEDLRLPGGKKTKTGYSTGAEILEKLAPDYQIVRDVLEYRQLSKLKSTYADGLASFIDIDGKIHGTFHQKVTATGRLSSSDPNLQNIPIRMPLGREIRKVFIPEDGYLFVSADYSQIELRVLAHMAGDQNLIKAYQNNADIHTSTASQVFGVPVEQVTPNLRRNAKAVNFGIVYGISAFGLSQDLDITRKEAGEYIEKYFNTYPGIKKYLDDNVASAKENGYVTTLFGRIRPIPELASGNFMTRSFGERAAMNSSIQGTAADIIKIAMIRVSERFYQENLKSRLILQIHDELLVETYEPEKEIVENILRQEMEGAVSLNVPLIVDIEEGYNWYEAK